MALYHLHVRNISRSDGRSAVACAAYRAGETLPNAAEEKASSFGGRRDVVFAELRLPAQAPAWMADRASLWNAVEQAEKRKDARLAKEIEFALPRELARSEWLGLARQMADAYVSLGHVVDLAIHDDGTAHNPHVHLMLTTRAIGADGFGAKLRAADGKAFVKDARALWAKIANAALGAAGFAGIDPRSHAARGIREAPGQHLPPDQAARREHREGRARMNLQDEVIAARNALVATVGIRERYPVLAARPDWPPEQRNRDDHLPPDAKAEHDRFWREVHQRALEPEREENNLPEQGRGGDGLNDVVRVGFAVEAQSLAAVATDAAGNPGVLDRIIAVGDARDSFAALRDRMVTEMVRAGLMDPRTAEHVRIIEQKLYPDEFARMRAAAQRLEAKRREPSVEPQPTRAMFRQAAELERQEFESRGVAYAPPKQPSDHRLDLHGDRQPEPLRTIQSDVPDPVPDPDGRPIAPAELEVAEQRMLQEVEAPDRAISQPPSPERAPELPRQAAAEAVARQNRLKVPEQDAEAYRLAPQESRLDWLQAQPRAAMPEPSSEQEPERTEDRLAWLRVMPKPEKTSEQDREHHPDRYRR